MDHSRNKSIPLKKCQTCGKIWQTVDDLLKLKDLIPLGFQAHFTDGNKSVLLFHHNLPNCCTTIAIPITEFAHLIPHFYEYTIEIGTDVCKKHCLTDGKLVPCDHPKCRNALVRDFVQKLVHKKSMATSSPVKNNRL